LREILLNSFLQFVIGTATGIAAITVRFAVIVSMSLPQYTNYSSDLGAVRANNLQFKSGSANGLEKSQDKVGEFYKISDQRTKLYRADEILLGNFGCRTAEYLFGNVTGNSDHLVVVEVAIDNERAVGEEKSRNRGLHRWDEL
jgi:hypothetical protein